MTAPTGPLPLRPRLDGKPWGGRLLADYGLAYAGDEPLGEALATAPEAVVGAGPLAGRALGEVVAADPARWAGERGLAVTGGRAVFPLLVKLIDAGQHLSIQVHPDDATAPAGKLGKTEAWHVLAAEPGGVLFLGLRPDVEASEFGARCRDGGDAAGCLRRVPAVPGTTVLIPAGTVHALGAGVLVYEVQQPSDVTYRLHDWGRRDAAGNPRALHLDEGLTVLRPESRPEPIPPVDLPGGAGRRQRLVETRHFALERIALVAGERLGIHVPDSPQALTCLRGGAGIAAEGLTATIAPGETAVVPAAAAAEVVATAPVVLLRTWVPSRGTDQGISS